MGTERTRHIILNFDKIIMNIPLACSKQKTDTSNNDVNSKQIALTAAATNLKYANNSSRPKLFVV
jgi:hypothetical protein